MYDFILDAPDTDPIDLVDLESVKDELGIDDASSDDRLARWITDASGKINEYVGRVLRAQTVTQTFIARGHGPARNDGYWPERYGSHTMRRPGGLNFTRYPIVSVASVVEDGTTLIEAIDYETDPAAGILFRLSGSLQGSWSAWGGTRIAATYRGGWETTSNVPGGVKEAVYQMIAYRRGGRGRDPSVRQISIPGVMDKSYFAPTSSTVAPVGGLPPEIASAVDYLRDVHL